MNKQIGIYIFKDPPRPLAPETGLCKKTWAIPEGELLSQTGIPWLGNLLSAFAMESHGQKIHVVNCLNFSLVAADGSQERQYGSRGSVGGQDGRWQQVWWTNCYSLCGLKVAMGLNCHIVTVDPRVWGKNVCFWGEKNVLVVDKQSGYFWFGFRLFVTRSKQTTV